MNASALATVAREAPDVLTQYDVTAAQLAAFREECAGLTADTPAGYEAVRIAIGKARTARTTVEKTRKALKAEHLEKGRKIDAVAHALTDAVEEIEKPLQAMKDAVDGERERLKREAEKAELLALEAKIKADREAEEARSKAEAADREAKLAAERALFEEQKRKADEERAASEAVLRGERARLEAEAAAVAEQKRALHDRELAAARADKERKDAADREEAKRLAAIQAEKDATEAAARAALEEARLEALRPDVERVHAWGRAIADFVASAPTLDSDEGAEAIEWGRQRLLKTADFLEKWQPGGAA